MLKEARHNTVQSLGALFLVTFCSKLRVHRSTNPSIQESILLAGLRVPYAVYGLPYGSPSKSLGKMRVLTGLRVSGSTGPPHPTLNSLSLSLPLPPRPIQSPEFRVSSLSRTPANRIAAVRAGWNPKCRLIAIHQSRLPSFSPPIQINPDPS